MNEYEITHADMPDGYALQWVACKVLGEKVSVGQYLRSGWEPVLRSDFDGKYEHFFYDTDESSPEVIHAGQILLKKPWAKLGDAREKERQAAQEQMNRALQRIGTLVDPSELIKLAEEAHAIRDEDHDIEPTFLPRSRWARVKVYLHRLHVWLQVKMLSAEQRDAARIARVSERCYAENVIELRRLKRNGYYNE